MSDVRGPLGGGDTGGDELLKAAERARERAQRTVQGTEQAAGEMEGAARGVKGARRRVQGAQRELNDAERALLQEYITAEQAGSRKAADLRKRLEAGGIKTGSTVGQGLRRAPESTRAAFGSTRWQREFEQALQKSSFQFTPDPRALAAEAARQMGGGNLPTDISGGSRTQTALRQRAAELERARQLLAPYAQQHVEQMSPAQRAGFQERAQALVRGPSGPITYAHGKPDRAYVDPAVAERKLIDDMVAAREQEATATQRTEQRKTEAVQQGERARYEARRLNKAFGVFDTASQEFLGDKVRGGREFRRRYFNAEPVAQANAQALNEGLQFDSPEFKRRVRALRTQSRAPEKAREAQAEADLDRKMADVAERSEDRKTRAVERGTRARTDLQARESAGGGGRAVVERMAQLQREADAIEEKRAQRGRRQKDVTQSLGGNEQEFNRILGDRVKLIEQEIAAAERYDQAVKRGQAAAPGSEKFREQVAQQEAAIRAREQLAGPGTDVIRHPELFNRQVFAPVTREQVRQPAGERVTAVPRPRTDLQAAVQRAAEADVAAQRSREALDTARRRAARATGADADALTREVATLTQQHSLNTDRVRASRAEVQAIRQRNRAAQDAAQADAQAAREAERAPGTELIRHPELYGKQAYAPISHPQTPATPVEEVNLSRRANARDPRQRAAAQSAADAAKATAVASAAADRYARNMDIVAASEARAAAVSQALTQEIRYQGAMLGATDTSFRRRGALTTEFIEAAARGEASFREWGYQLGATAAKFAGWTAVSIPVFAALDGIRRLGEGAIASASGVGVLQRSLNSVNADQAQRSFRDLSAQFNLPISDVVDAVYRSSQVFHDQADAAEAAKAALYSMRVGEVDVATSTRYLNAIVSGFRLGTGEQLVQVFDQINQAQNRFGISIANTEAGTARAAGAFRNAGGSVSYLLGLLVTGQRVTGRTGENIGTALQRSVGFIQRPTNRQSLREFGIDPSQGIEAVFEQAFQVARTLQGEQLQKLATALSSPQYASYFVPILQNRQLFERVMRETSPEVSKGSAQRELDKVLGQVDERIKRIGTNLQQLGSSLAQSGMLNIFAGGLTLLNGLLGTTNQLLNVFNELPAPIRTALTALLQMRLVLGGLRRFNVGEGLQGGRFAAAAPFLVESDERRARRLVGGSVRAGASAAQGEQARVQAASYRAVTAAERAAEAKVAEFSRVNARLAEGAIDEATAAELKAAAAQRALAAEERALVATEASRAALVQTARAEQDLADYQESRRAGVPARQFAAERQLPVPPVLDRPFTMAPEVRRRILAGEEPLDVGAAAGTTGVPAATQNQGRLRASLAAQAAQLQQIRSSTTGVARAQATWTAATIAAEAGLARSTVALRAMPGRLRAMAVGVGAMFGPLEAIVIASLVLPEAYQALSEEVKRLQTGANRTQGLDPQGNSLQVDTRKGIADDRKKLRKLADDHGSFWDAQIDWLRALREGDIKGALLGRELPEVQTSKDAKKRLEDVYGGRSRAQAAARRSGDPVPLLSSEGLRTRLDRDFDLFDQGRITLAELRDRQAKRFKEIEESLVTGDTQQRLRAEDQRRLFTRTAAASKPAFLSSLTKGGLGAAPGDWLRSQSEGLQALVGADVASPSQEYQNRALQLVIAARNRTKTDPAGRQAFAESAQALRESLAAVGKDELDRALAVATSQGERDAAYSTYLRTVDAAGRAVLRGRVSRLEAQRQQALRQQREAQRQQRVLNVGPTTQIPGLAGGLAQAGGTDAFGVPFALSGLQLGLEGARNALEAQLKTRAGALGKKARAAKRAIDSINKVLDQALDAIRKETEAAAADQAKSDAADRVQEQAALIQARAHLAAAGTTTDVGAQQAQLAGLRNLLAFEQAHAGTGPGQYKPSEIVELQAQVGEATKQLAQTVAQEARDLISAQYGYRESLTDDPVKLARLEADKAGALFKQGGFKNQAERLNALAERNRARQAAQQSVSDRQIENVEYEHDIGKLTDEAYIRALQRIERTMKQGSEARRQLRMKIGRLQHDLENESDFSNLDVGNIRLPTVYDVRRIARQGIAANSTVQSNSFTFHVRNDADVEAIGGHLERMIPGVTAGMRSAGMRG